MRRVLDSWRGQFPDRVRRRIATHRVMFLQKLGFPFWRRLNCLDSVPRWTARVRV